MTRRVLRMIVIGILATGAVAVLAIAVLLGSMWLEHRRDTTLPAPTGPLAVGRLSDVWSDPATRRELLAWTWYPAVAPQSPAPVEYLPAPWRTATERQRVALINTLLTRDLSRVRAHSIRDATVSPQQDSYPVIVMIGGLNFTTLAEDLASHGYVVVSIEAPHRSGLVVFPDGRVIERAPENNPDLVSGEQREQLAVRLVDAGSADIGWALDQLGRLNTADPSGPWFGRLDLQRVGVLGHSLGGAIALQFCHDDPRCQAVIDIDGAPHGSVVKEGITQPLLFLLSDHSGESDAATRQIQANIRAVRERLPGDRSVEITVRGANHYSFSDDGAMLKSQILRGMLRVFGLVGIDGRRQVIVTAYCVRSFFDVYLNGAPASGLRSQREYPEIQIEN